MKHKNLIHLLTNLVVLALLSSGCKEINQATPAPTPIPLRITHTPALRPWVDQLGLCAARQPDTTVFIEERPFNIDDLTTHDAILRLGPLDEYSGFATVLGYEQIELAINPANPLNQIDSRSLGRLFSGIYATWEPISSLPGTTFTTTVQVWSYLPGDDLRHLPLQDALPATAWLGYDPGRVILGIAADPGALGYVPSHWLQNSNAGLKTAALPEELRQQLYWPVLAYSMDEPQGALRSLLSCASQQVN